MAQVGLFLLILLVPLLLLLAGAILLILSRRGRLAHPACGACGYDVTATVGSQDRCPECGERLVDAGVHPPGRPPRRTTMLAIGVVCLVLGGSCGVLTVGPMLFAATRSQAAAARARAAAVQQQQAALAAEEAAAAARAEEADAANAETSETPDDGR